jgi:AcrR family transcriptional regulator
MGDVVEASGLEKGTLYGHFSTKEELALLAFDYAWKDTSITLAKCEELQHLSSGEITVGIDLGDRYSHCCVLGPRWCGMLAVIMGKFRWLQSPPHDPQSWNIWLIHLKCVPTFGPAICWCERRTNTQ